MSDKFPPTKKFKQAKFSFNIRPHNDPDRQQQLQEYCQLETFQPRCWKNEIIIMESATYGRMRIGHCVEAEKESKMRAAMGDDPQYLGCSVDVLTMADRRCSGESQCDIRVTDSELEDTEPCYKGLRMYLEASYSCANVVGNDRSCLVSASNIPVHIPGSSLPSIACGSKSQPWILEAPVGQQINISLIDFETGKSHSKSQNPNCNSYGFILEKSNRRNVSICAGKTRKTKLFESTSHMIEIVLTLKEKVPTELIKNRKFLLRIEAIGCSDLIPPEDAWLKRSINQATIGCYSSRQTWQLRCDGRQWIGVVGNCSILPIAAESVLIRNTKKSDHQVLGIVAISGVGLAICLMIVCIGALCIRRITKCSDHKYENRNQQIRNTCLKDPIGPLHPQQFFDYNQRFNANSLNPTNAVCTGSDGDNCNSGYDVQNRITDNLQYFVLDQDIVANEQLLCD